MNINYLLNNYKEVVWLLGDGRSGTTWVSNLIKEEKLYREMFETFHPLLVDKFSFLLPHQYMRPEVSNERFKQFSSDVFSGKFTHPRVDFSNHSLVYKGLILKDIFANLFAYWVSIRFPQIKIILLLRNPFSVAISKNRKKEWYWLTEPLNLLEQPDLYEDYLVPFADIIRDVSDDIDYITSQVLIWSIINYVPLRQFKPDKIHIVFYEDMLINPNHEVAKIFRFINPDIKIHQLNPNRAIITDSSRSTNNEKNAQKLTLSLNQWKNKLSLQQIETGRKILELFDFDKLYSDNSIPNRSVLSKFHN